jgi:glycosyltransferase 2 family protein
MSRLFFATTTVGFAAILFVGRAGEIVRPMWLPMRDKRIRPSAALVTIFVERVFDLASLMAFFSLSLMFFRTPVGRETEFASIKLVGNILLAVIVAGLVGMIIYHRNSARIIDWAATLTDRSFVPKRLRHMFLSLMRNMATALDILRSPREIFLATFWTVALWLSIAIPTWLVLIAFDLPMSFLDSTFVMGVASLGSLIPTPGGAAGAFHAATAGSLIILGIEREQAAAVSIVMHLLYFVPALLFGLYYLFHGDISIERFRSLLSSENAEREIESDSPDFESGKGGK